MYFLDVFVLFVLIAIALIYIKKQYAEVEHMVSDVDGKKYLVLSLPDKQEAANTLARLNQDMLALIQYLTEKHPDDPVVRRLQKNYDPNNISEGSPDSGYTSYTVNKGQKLVLCIRQKDASKKLITDRNLLRYVVFHEAGHYASKGIGHNKEFWKNFKFIIKEAVDAGLYTKVNYKEHPQPYCGITVSSSII
jgi:predicted metal-dependent hydrolase